MMNHIEERDTTVAAKTLLFLLAAFCGVVAGTLALFFEFKIMLGLMMGLFFSAIIILRPLVGLVFLICVMPVLEIFPPDFFGVGILNPTNLILALVTVAALLYRIMVLKQGIARRTFVLPLALYGLALVFSAVMNLVQGIGTLGEIADIIRTYLNGAYLYFVTTNVINDERDAKWVFGAVVFAVIFVTIWGLFEYRSSLVTMAAGRVRISGRVGQPNSFGAFLAYYLPFILGAIRVKGLPRFARVLLIGGAVSVFFSLLFTQSRGAYVGFLCMALFMGFLITRKLLVVMLFAGLTYQLWLPPQVIDRVNETFTGGGEEEQFDGSTETRLMLYKAGLHLFVEKPIWGHGFGGFSRLSESRGVTDTRRAAHSLYIQMLVDMGLIGVLAILNMWFHLFRRAARLRREGKSSFERTFGESFMACIVAIVMTNIFGIRFYNFLEIGYFWCLGAILVYYTERAREERTKLAERGVRTAA
jgi:O-antigen ligase